MRAASEQLGMMMTARCHMDAYTQHAPIPIHNNTRARARTHSHTHTHTHSHRTQEEGAVRAASLAAERDDCKALLLATLQVRMRIYAICTRVHAHI